MGTFNLFPFPLVFGDLIFVLHLILFIYLFFFVCDDVQGRSRSESTVIDLNSVRFDEVCISM